MLAIAMIAVLTVAALTAGMLQLSQSTSRRQTAARNTKLAFYMAEAGLSEAYSGLIIGKTGSVGSQVQPAAFGEGLFWVEATDNADNTIDLTSTGMIGNGRAVLSIVVERSTPSVASLGVFSNSRLNLQPGTLIDGYDSQLGSYADQLIEGRAPTGAGRLGSNDIIEVAGNRNKPTLINGDLTPGPEQQVSVRGQVEIIGSTDPAPASTPLPPVETPALALEPGVRVDAAAPLVILPGELGLEFLTVTPYSEVILRGPSTILIGSLRVESNASLLIDTTDGPVNLYITEELDLQPSSLLQTSGQDPSQVSIQVPGPTATPIQLASTTSFHGVIYAPEAELTVLSEFEVFGALIGDNVIFTGPARMHFDQYLEELSAEAALPTLLSWRILELSTVNGAGATANLFQFLGLDRALLAKPADAHADQLVSISYEDLGGTPRTYDGPESAFNWNNVRLVSQLTRDGVAVRRAARRKPMLDIARDASLSSSEVRDKLVAGSPLTARALLAAIERTPPMNSSHLKAVLDANAPATPGTLKAAIQESALSSSDIRDVMILNSPLGADVLAGLAARIPPLNASDLQAVIDAQ